MDDLWMGPDAIPDLKIMIVHAAPLKRIANSEALQVRRLIKNDFDSAFKKVDIIVGPVSPTTAFKIGEKSSDPLALYLEDIYTVPVNLAGLPGMSIPCGFDGGLPVGLQLIAPWFAEAKMLNAAHRYQLTTDWHRRLPAGLEA